MAAQEDLEAQVERLLAEHSDAVRLLAGRLRSLLLAAEPAFSERVYPGWHAIGYRHPRAGYVCGIFPRSDGVRLGFEHGVLLEPHCELLVGSGSQVRYLEIAAERDLRADVIGELVDLAVALRT